MTTSCAGWDSKIAQECKYSREDDIEKELFVLIKNKKELLIL